MICFAHEDHYSSNRRQPCLSQGLPVLHYHLPNWWWQVPRMDSYSESTVVALKSIRITERHENTHPTDGLERIRRVACWMLADGLRLAGFAARWIPIEIRCLENLTKPDIQIS